MADLYDRNLSPTVINFSNQEAISIQLHLTTKCDMNCKHCYMHEDGFVAEDSDFEIITSFLNKIKQKCVYEKKKCAVALTGGDPILSKNFWPIIDYLDSNKDVFSFVIMGNSFHIDDVVAAKLRTKNLLAYQVSLDGLKEFHDYNRKEGSFEDTVRCLKVLHDAGIKTCVMFTACKTNYKDFISLMHFLDDLKTVDTIGFDKIIPQGNALGRTDIMSAYEYRDFLYSVYIDLITSKMSIKFSFKDNLWKLLFWQLGIVNPISDETQTITGCLACSDTISVLPNGDYMSCRRINKVIGNVQCYQINHFLNRDLSMYRNIEVYEKCRDCELWAFCRGCVAARKINSNTFISQDPYCWKD